MTNRIEKLISTFPSTNRFDPEQSQILIFPLEIINQIGSTLVPREQANLSSTCFHAAIYANGFEKTNLLSLQKEIGAIKDFLTKQCNSNEAKAALEKLMPQIDSLLEKMILQNTKEIKAKISILLYEIVHQLPQTEQETVKAQKSPVPSFWGLNLSTLAYCNTSLVESTQARGSDLHFKLFKFIATCSEFIPLEKIKNSLELLHAQHNLNFFEFLITVIEKLCEQGRWEEAEQIAHFAYRDGKIDVLQQLAEYMFRALRALEKQSEPPLLVKFAGFQVDMTAFQQSLFAPIQPHLQQLWAKKMKEGDLDGVTNVIKRIATSFHLLATIVTICKNIDQNTQTTHFQDNNKALKTLFLYLLKHYSIENIVYTFLNKLDVFHEGKVFALKFCEMLAKNKHYKEAFKIADHAGNIWITQDAFNIIIDLASMDPKVSANELIEALRSIRNSNLFFDNFHCYQKYDAFPGWVRHIQMKKAFQYAKNFLTAWFFSREKDSS
ncbi:MAG TPA: hypothetical protein VHK67_07510 [Rhabdochlamydiaceae bacterium]|jgi:hypothetical protein|nr:hypothetical protein [Rhabdochlamydiaceae bacterium]